MRTMTKMLLWAHPAARKTVPEPNILQAAKAASTNLVTILSSYIFINTVPFYVILYVYVYKYMYIYIVLRESQEPWSKSGIWAIALL